MTEVPDYLLQRSRERRAALGLAPQGGAAAEGAAAPAADAGSAPADTGAEAAAPAAASPAPAAASAPAPATAKADAPPRTPIDTRPRSGIPVWMMPVLLVLPLWAIVYAGAFTEGSGKELSPAEMGAQVYRSAGCGGCHGAAGEGAVGPALAGGEAALTFPDEAEHVKWIETGSAPTKGQPYGDPARPGGQRTENSGGMPGFAGTLSPEEIEAVVLFEREQL